MRISPTCAHSFVAVAAALVALCLSTPPARAQTLTLSAPQNDPIVLGICSRVLKEAFRRSRLDFVLKKLPLQRGLEEANDGVTDGDLCRIPEATAVFPNLMMLKTPMYHSYTMVYGRTPEFTTLTREQLVKLKAAYQRGLLPAREATKGMDVIETSTRENAIALLTDGRVDMVVFGYAQSFAANADALRNKTLVMWPHVWRYFPLSLTLNKRNAALAPRIEAALATMQREGLIEKINDEVLAQFHVPPVPSDAPAAAQRRPNKQ